MKDKDYEFLDQEAVELLSATIIRRAYEDLLEAYLIDAAVEFHDISYNCAMYYERMQKAKEQRYQASSVSYQSNGNTPEDRQDAARREIAKLKHWFQHSERCRMMLKNAKGEWFVEQAKRKMTEFVKDKTMPNELHVVLNRVDGQTEKTRKRALSRWKKERDAWRKEHGLSEVKDAE